MDRTYVQGSNWPCKFWLQKRNILIIKCKSKRILIFHPWKFQAAGKRICWKFLSVIMYYFTVISLLLRKRMTILFLCYLQGHSARSKPVGIMPGKCVLVILHPANTHPPCEHSTGMELCPDKQIHTDFCLSVLWAWLSCWHLLTTQDACSLLQQLLFSPWICAKRKNIRWKLFFLVNVF